MGMGKLRKKPYLKKGDRVVEIRFLPATETQGERVKFILFNLNYYEEPRDYRLLVEEQIEEKLREIGYKNFFLYWKGNTAFPVALPEEEEESC
jgi:hypothetical protein